MPTKVGPVGLGGTDNRDTSEPVAELASGGLDSAVLLAAAASSCPSVYPLYVTGGLSWVGVERDYLGRSVAAVGSSAIRPPHLLEPPAAGLDPDHSALTGRGDPTAGTPDAAVLLPGRNLLLVSKATPWCHLAGVPAVALGTLAGNPFPDATPQFFDACARLVNRAVGGTVRVALPYAAVGKADVVRRGARLPLRLTFSRLRPVGRVHCGPCDECYERRQALVQAGRAGDTECAAGRTVPAGRLGRR